MTLYTVVCRSHLRLSLDTWTATCSGSIVRIQRLEVFTGILLVLNVNVVLMRGLRCQKLVSLADKVGLNVSSHLGLCTEDLSFIP
jgi:hypothetical protein